MAFLLATVTFKKSEINIVTVTIELLISKMKNFNSSNSNVDIQ